MAGHGSLMEVKFQWTIDDLMDCHEAMEIKADKEQHLMKKNKGGS